MSCVGDVALCQRVGSMHTCWGLSAWCAQLHVRRLSALQNVAAVSTSRLHAALCVCAVLRCAPSRLPGDTVLGYDMAKANLVHMDFESHVNRGGAVPDVLLVRKSYEEKRRKHKNRVGGRAWKLKHLDIEMGEER